MRVAIVNDLAIAREILRRLLATAPGYTVAWMAADGAEAVRNAAADRPDAILMDLIMPVMDGVEATRRIMAQSPCPILLVTSSVSGNYDRVYEAMGCGGLDAVNTPKIGPNGALLEGDAILTRLAKLQRAKAFTAPSTLIEPVAVQAGKWTKPTLLAVGASTGGPEALHRLLSGLPPDFPAPIILVQHIAREYAGNLAHWLHTQTGMRVEAAKQGEMPMPATAYLAVSNDHLILRGDGTFGYIAEPSEYPYRPSVNVFFESLKLHWRSKGMAVLLTGMGSDGASGLLRLRNDGWRTIAQDEASSVVYGMPRAAKEMNAAEEVLALGAIAPRVRLAFGC